MITCTFIAQKHPKKYPLGVFQPKWLHISFRTDGLIIDCRPPFLQFSSINFKRSAKLPVFEKVILVVSFDYFIWDYRFRIRSSIFQDWCFSETPEKHHIDLKDGTSLPKSVVSNKTIKTTVRSVNSKYFSLNLVQSWFAWCRCHSQRH